MTSQAAAFIGFLGFLLTLGGVGGIEVSESSTALLQSMLISCVGLALMYCSVVALKVSNYYDSLKG
jgi:hypothetical protein